VGTLIHFPYRLFDNLLYIIRARLSSYVPQLNAFVYALL